MDIDRMFKYHSPTGEQAKTYAENRGRFLELAKYIEKNCPLSRERTISIRKLEEAMFYANASIARS